MGPREPVRRICTWRFAAPDERPKNPLTHGFSVPDERLPQVRRFRLVPRDGESRVEDLAEARVVQPDQTLRATGHLGLQVDTIDTAGRYDHRLMPLGLEVRVDGEVVYSLEQRLFDFAQGRQMRLEIVREDGRPMGSAVPALPPTICPAGSSLSRVRRSG